LVDVDVEGKKFTTLIRERQHDVIKGSLLHVDFMVVSLTEKVSSNVSIVLEGEAPAVKELNGILVSGLELIEVEALPEDLPERIVVDVSNLDDFGSAIYVRDLVLPPGVEILGSPDEMVCVVTTPAAEEVEEVEEEIEELDLEAEPEVILKGKAEEEEEEGEEAE
jgi:large subunit ribosomal protein L25